jgi:hypothetical protein
MRGAYWVTGLMALGVCAVSVPEIAANPVSGIA